MNEMIWVAIFLFALWLYVIVSSRAEAIRDVKSLGETNSELQAAVESIKKEWADAGNVLAKERVDLKVQIQKAQEAERSLTAAKKLYEEKIYAIPWMASIYEDFTRTQIETISWHLTHKKNPAFTAAETINAMKADLAHERVMRKEAEYKCHFYEMQTEKATAEAAALMEEAKEQAHNIVNEANIYKKLHEEKLLAIPWLAKIHEDIVLERANVTINYLENKKNPAPAAAVSVREIKDDLAEEKRRRKEAEYLVAYYESLFPDLEELKSEDNGDVSAVSSHNDENAEDDDKSWLSPEEYKTLNTRQRAELAFERFKNARRSKWEIGRDYERYIGYIYEREGYRVTYHGIIKGLEDMGRDLICEKEGCVRVVQCKYWSSKKMIHEKHINQIFGTVIAYASTRLEKTNQLFSIWDVMESYNIKPVLYTSTVLSPTAKDFAKLLGVDVHENERIGNYPMIKCNINRQRGEKIYHMPYDQMYDRVVIEPDCDECYAMTIDEAETKGFRRAMRHSYMSNA